MKINKQKIQRYFDPENKGYISLCDVKRILIDILIWLCIIFGPGALLYVGTRYDIPNYSFIVCCIIMWVTLIFGLICGSVILFVTSYIYNLIIHVYEKYMEKYINVISNKYKPCKIKIIKLR